MTHPCDRCDGMGEVYTRIPLTWGEGGKPAGHVTQRVPCPDCDGTGAVRVIEHDNCAGPPACDCR